jgi:hypothetical protein
VFLIDCQAHGVAHAALSAGLHKRMSGALSASPARCAAWNPSGCATASCTSPVGSSPPADVRSCGWTITGPGPATSPPRSTDSAPPPGQADHTTTRQPPPGPRRTTHPARRALPCAPSTAAATTLKHCATRRARGRHERSGLVPRRTDGRRGQNYTAGRRAARSARGQAVRRCARRPRRLRRAEGDSPADELVPHRPRRMAGTTHLVATSTESRCRWTTCGPRHRRSSGPVTDHASPGQAGPDHTASRPS